MTARQSRSQYGLSGRWANEISGNAVLNGIPVLVSAAR